ncbi:MAG: hypothetical protein HQL44_13370 [Alphaproteobacteria bacterium]|nr:hypothetical protein [Alphaproteobacteria bacterium]
MTSTNLVFAATILACATTESLAGPKGIVTSYEAVFEGEMHDRSADQKHSLRLVMRQDGERLEARTDSSASGMLKGWRRNGLCSLKGRIEGVYLVLLGDCSDKSYKGNFTQIVEGGNLEGVFQLEAVSGNLKPVSARK